MQRILVIDDDVEVRGMLEPLLTSAGYKVDLAKDGAEGVRCYRASPADLVITDLVMPKQEGLETIRELRRTSPEVNILAMSGRPAAEALLSVARRLGAVAVLQKPFLTDQLLSIITSILPPRQPLNGNSA